MLKKDKIETICNAVLYEHNEMKKFREGFKCVVEFELDQHILEQPLHWRKPQVIAVQWLGDIFHEQIELSYIDHVFDLIFWDRVNHHKLLLLTKRIERAKEILSSDIYSHITDADNVWLGLSISTQQEANEKIPILLQIPASHRFVNLEPMLEEVSFRWAPWVKFSNEPGAINDHLDGMKGIDWVALGCESGPGRRPMNLEWAMSIAEQCKAAGVPLWIKQVNIDGKVIKDINLFPKELQIREFPWK